jgi:hypothetical protein
VNAGNLQRVERLNYLLGGILVIAAALTQPRSMALGIAVGVALTCLNFFLLRKLVAKWTDEAAKGISSTSALLVLPKMIGLMGAVVLCLWLLPIQGIGFAIGYSVFVVSIFVEIILSAVLPGPSAPPHDSSDVNHG